ncbi:MAG TPA: DUF1629 domain-containing protein [Gammaproteobacteria bacterium]|nr:DUF1629 domain-containing protein [Gammaproteobacteria bacterium]
MDFFLWDTGGDVDDDSLVFIEDPPEGMGLRAAKLALGKSAQKHVPEEPVIRLRKENRGLELPGFIGNTVGLLILSKPGVEVVRQMCPNERLEIFPFVILNHKKRVHSRDYSIVNPLGGFDCLDEAASGVTRDAGGDVKSIAKYVLSKPKIDKAPHLFRIREKPVEYVFSRALGRRFNEAGVTNVWGNEMPQV